MSPGTLPSWLYEEATADYVALNRTTPAETRIKAIAFYLPQFHPIPENDAWWGKGFTEWTNVSRAKPQFAEHYQPHLPGELGFYDLRLVDVQRRQLELARLHGIHGFCYHHYWFGGKRLLRQPLDQLLAHPELDFPFCLCWANENWTRKWDGLDDDVLIGQQHSPEDDLAFIRDIEPALRDPRYIKVGDRPLLIVYRPALLPDAFATAMRWRTYCREIGLGDLFLASTHAFDRQDPRDVGFDAAVEFAPNNMAAAARVSDVTEVNPGFRGVLYDYRELVSLNCDRQPPPEGYTLFRSVTPMWDNEARRPGRGTVFVHSSPHLYETWLENVCRWTECHVGNDSPFVFLNAWNEWAEGAHLEPDRRYGYAYLEATARVLERFPAVGERATIVCVSHDAYFHGAQLLALHLCRTLAARLGYRVEVILCGPGPLVKDFEQIGRVHDFSASGLSPEGRLATVRELRESGARVAICNTSVVGETAELLKRQGFSVVSVIHELPNLIRSYGLEESIARIADHADKVVFAANVVREQFISMTGLSRDRSVVQPQGLFAPNEHFGCRQSARRDLRTQLRLEGDARIVLAVGFADHRKGIDLFVDVGIQVLRDVAGVVFVWVGHHEQSAIDRAYARLEKAAVRDRFVFPGLVANSDLYFAGADAYLMTSREDPFPNVVVQALDAELPVIGFRDAGGFVELLERGCGVLVPFEDTSAMATALVQILRSPEQAERLATAAREVLAREFSFVNYARTLVELVEPARPRVSVVVPNFNYAKYLPARLKSIISQTSPPHEVLFLDDCSSDGSIEIAKTMLHSSGLAYRVITNDVNQGTYRQWLRGLREATGDLVWIAEADDDCAPDFLARLIPEFDRPDVVLAYCQSRQIDEEGREIAPDYQVYTADISESKWRAGYVRPGPDEIQDTLVVKNTIPNVSAVLMRRVDVSRIEERLLGLRNAGDWLLYVHLLAQGSIAYLADSLNDHRRHSSSVTIGRGGLNLMREIVMVQQHILERYQITPETDRKREAALQTTYEYLGLHRDGPASYRDHEALKEVEWALSR
jgi:glycosyltransferase involved in cell wall biosynthesis